MRVKMDDFWESDFTGDVMHEVIRWVYLRTVDPDALMKHATKMLDAAEQFLLPSLVREVEREMINQINSENVFSTIEIADRYNVSSEVKECKNDRDYLNFLFLSGKSERGLHELCAG